MFKWIIKKFSGDKKEETLPEGTHTKPVVIKAEPKKKKAPAKKPAAKKPAAKKTTAKKKPAAKKTSTKKEK